MKKILKHSPHLLFCLLAASGILLSACEERFEINVPNEVAEGIVFLGAISNEDPPYFVRLTKPASLSAPQLEYEGIDDALVVITDVTEDIKDTLQCIKPYEEEGGLAFPYYNYHLKKEEGNWIHKPTKVVPQGVYITTKLYGKEGHTYRLDITYKGIQHTAEETMRPRVPITDLKVIKVDLGEKGYSYAPCISFRNPLEEENYYMFEVYRNSLDIHSLTNFHSLYSTPPNWAFSILSDEHLEENVVDYIVSDGENSNGYPPGSFYPTGEYLHVFLQAISKGYYDFSDRIIKQFRNDGGAFSPRPTDIKGNISGNVWGYFRVISQTVKGIQLEKS